MNKIRAKAQNYYFIVPYELELQVGAVFYNTEKIINKLEFLATNGLEKIVLINDCTITNFCHSALKNHPDIIDATKAAKAKIKKAAKVSGLEVKFKNCDCFVFNKNYNNTFNKNYTNDYEKIGSFAPFIPKKQEDFIILLDKLATGIYKRTSAAGFKKVILGISGGLDSTLALISAHIMCSKYGIDTQNIISVMLPSSVSSARTKTNGEKLIDALGTTKLEFSIQDAVDRHIQQIGHTSKTDVVYENAQARERTQILLSLATMHSAIMLGTSDLSELALGFSTYGGDSVSHFNPNTNIPKTLVKALINYASGLEQYSAIAATLQDILKTPISPELLANQDTEKIIGAYELHDFFLYYLFKENFSVKSVYQKAQETLAHYPQEVILKTLKTFISRFFNTAFKRSAAPDGIEISSFSLKNIQINSEFKAEVFLKAINECEL